MFVHKTPALVKWLYPQLIWSIKRSDKVIYLTFDDGPIPGLTDAILNILADFEAKATFFCVGDNLRKYPEIAERTLEKGHKLGNHTFNHIKGWSCDTNEYLHNVQKCEDQLSNFKIKNTLFRPPYGRIKRVQIRHVAQTHRIIMWDVLTGDYSQGIKPEDCLKNSIAATQNGSIVLFHDNNKAKKNVQYALPRYLEYFTKQGYTFKTL